MVWRVFGRWAIVRGNFLQLGAKCFDFGLAEGQFEGCELSQPLEEATGGRDRFKWTAFFFRWEVDASPNENRKMKNEDRRASKNQQGRKMNALFAMDKGGGGRKLVGGNRSL